MSDTQQRQEASLDPELSSAGQRSAGEMLKRERERQGLTVDEVAVQLNLRPAVVNGLEADQYSEVPVAAYRRGYLRAYARLMGIDETPVVAAYNAQHGDTRSDVERRVAPVQRARKPSRVGAWIFKLFTLLVILGLIGLTLLWWQSRNGNDLLGLGGSGESSVVESMNDDAGNGNAPTDATAQDESMPPVADQESDLGLVESDDAAAPAGAGEDEPPLVDDEAAPVDNDVAATSPDGETATPSNAATGDGASETSPDTGTASPADDATPAAAESDAQAPAVNQRQLSLTFNEQSWTEIYDATDRRILVGLQSAGTQATAEGEPPFRLTIGNASGVTLDYRGEAVDLSAHTGGNNVARFTLGE
ncbi:RodZ domain-containing protein [Modicisalibacter radicis]|uniref:RodZ domain-containing protein n=1 Tax=Halomonas sp. EAR18 TaxID=2518972 RepID=UPI00109CC650|nr:RodZ domain-containing protein [Halomonas sp. EAR18]